MVVLDTSLPDRVKWDGKNLEPSYQVSSANNFLNNFIYKVCVSAKNFIFVTVKYYGKFVKAMQFHCLKYYFVQISALLIV